MDRITKHLPLPEVWKRLEGDDATKREALSQVVAERVRAAGLRGEPVTAIRELLDAGELAAIDALLDAGAGESVAAPYEVALHGMRGGGFTSLFAGKAEPQPALEPTRAETLLAQGNLDDALDELRFNPADRLEVDIGNALRYLDAGNLRAAYSTLEQMRPKDDGVKALMRCFAPSGMLARVANWFKDNPDPDSVTFGAEQLDALSGRFSILKTALERLAGSDGSVTIARTSPTAGDYKPYVDRGAALVPPALLELAEEIRNYDRQTEPGEYDKKLSGLYRKAASQMVDVRNELYSSSPIRPEVAARLARTVERSTPDVEMVHEAEVYRQIAEALSFAGPTTIGTLHWLSNNGTRANAHQGFRDLNIGFRGDGNKTTVFHEFGHHIEFNHPEVLAACRAFLDDRCTGEARPLNELMEEKSRYRPDEKARPDDFISPYVGKVYESITEVVSVGFQYLADERAMVKLLVEDPEHLFLTLGIVLANRQ